jgi:hypothetical protein
MQKLRWLSATLGLLAIGSLHAEPADVISRQPTIGTGFTSSR